MKAFKDPLKIGRKDKYENAQWKKKHKKAPNIKATIWLSVILDAHIPMAVNTAAKNDSPM